MLEKIQRAIADAVNTLYRISPEVQVDRPEEQFGDYSTNVALQLAGQLHLNPTEIADKICDKLRVDLGDQIEDIAVVGNFINIRLSGSALLTAVGDASNYSPKSYQHKIVVVEYSDPNPFKVLHVGHLYTSVVGDSIANLLETAGATVHRVNFGGDVGLHVAKTLWATLYYSSDGDIDNVDKAVEIVKKLESESLLDRSKWLAQQYVRGTADYDDDKQGAKAHVADLNKRIYQLVADNDHDSPLAQIYWTCRQWSYDYFESFYREIDVHPFEKYYPESQTGPIGIKAVNEQLSNRVYKKSRGAIVFDGEKYGLHTRVFINSAGLPTYETKDVGLILLKWQDYHYDQSIVITANEIIEYMKVVLKSIEQFEPKLVERTKHLTHGLVKLQGGKKMSSRKGNIVGATDILEATAKASQKLIGKENQLTTLGAIKYAFLKQRLGADVIYDPAESVSLIGNSGPYLQYAHARARSVLSKATDVTNPANTELQPDERSLARKISEYPEVIEKATNELVAHYICTYLYELAQNFNSFYENNHVIDDPRQEIRLRLVEAYANTLKKGLSLLGIPTPEHL